MARTGIFDEVQFIEDLDEEALMEFGSIGARFKVFSNKCYEFITGYDGWTLDKVNRCIKEVEHCNKLIEKLEKNPGDLSASQALGNNKYYNGKLFRDLCGAVSIGAVIGVTFWKAPLLDMFASIGAGFAIGLTTVKRLKKENQRALKYLYKQKEKLTRIKKKGY